MAAEFERAERKISSRAEQPGQPPRAQGNRTFPILQYDTLIARDKASLDPFWLKGESLDNLDDLPPPDVPQQEIIDHLEAALVAFRDVAAGLQHH